MDRHDPPAETGLDHPTSDLASDTQKLAREADPIPGPRAAWSREARAWMAGLSALVVALAAVAPFVHSADVHGALANVKDVADKAGDVDATDLENAGQSCNNDDNSAGFGGNEASCTFVCPEGPGTVSVYADADDSSAMAIGTADCQGDAAHCSAQGACDKTEARTNGGPGDCKGSSDEWINSGIYVSCSAKLDDVGGGVTPGAKGCVVHDPDLVCVGDVCALVANALADRCMVVADEVDALLRSGAYSSAGFWTDGSSGIGMACGQYGCSVGVPLCLTRDGATTCSLRT